MARTFCRFAVFGLVTSALQANVAPTGNVNRFRKSMHFKREHVVALLLNLLDIWGSCCNRSNFDDDLDMLQTNVAGLREVAARGSYYIYR